MTATTEFKDTADHCFAWHQERWWRIERVHPYRLSVLRDGEWEFSKPITPEEMAEFQ